MSTKLVLAKNELDKLKIFEEYKNRTMARMVEVLGEDVPEHMSMTIANYTMAGFIGHFHYKIELSQDNIVPMNMVAFILAKSGARKTSSVTKLEKVIQPGLDIINIRRLAKIEDYARRNDIPIPKLNPLSNALATEAGMIKRLNDFKKEGLGLPTMFVDEIATELAVNQDMIPNIKLIAQLFDEGNMKSKPLKDSENQSEEVIGMGMNALFIGSEYGILEDNGVLEKFNLEFISKLSRRCFFVYPDFPKQETNAENIDDLLTEIKDKKMSSVDTQMKLGGLCQKIALGLKDRDINKTTLEPDAERLYEIYKIYCEEVAETITLEQVTLEQQHRHWKALKLAGVYSIFNLHRTIEINDLKEAIYVAELGADNLEKFISKAERNAHEKLHDHYIEEQPPLSVHDILKRKWIKKAIEIEDLLRFANSKLGNVGVFKLENDTVILERFVETEGVGCSYKMCAGTKNERKYKITDSFKYARAPFGDMAKILSNDTAYTNFEFLEGIRGKDNVIGACDYVILDIDDTDINDVECSNFLADYKHIICRTSNAENPYKYRIIIPTDIAVDVTNEQWPHFMRKVGEYLGMDIDILPKAQIYYGYSGREPIIQLEGEDLEASELIKGLHIPKVEIKKLSSDKLKRVYADRLRVFEWFYNSGSEAPIGSDNARANTHNTLWLASVHAHDLGLPLDVALAIMYDIDDFRQKKVRPGYLAGLERRMKTYIGWVGQKTSIEEEKNEEYKY
ncbi:MAG: hypothetical protein DRQ78_07635 [Epsilonproteobacteria bacterium]|nr:MAG: hypothetical protein DRQ78_07635 [Campylobacterota bacterium]